VHKATGGNQFQASSYKDLLKQASAFYKKRNRPLANHYEAMLTKFNIGPQEMQKAIKYQQMDARELVYPSGRAELTLQGLRDTIETL